MIRRYFPASLALALLASLCVVTGVSAFSFEALPNANGTVDVRASHEWEWAPGIYSGLRLSLSNPMDAVKEANAYVATSGRVIESSADIIGVRFGRRRSIGAALNFQYSNDVIREIGYVDAAGPVRYFLVNDRTIDMFLPRLTLEFDDDIGPLRISADAEAAPWLGVRLGQSLYVGSSGSLVPRTLDTFSTGWAAASGRLGVALDLPAFMPELECTVDYVPIAYEYLDYSYARKRLDSTIINFGIMGGVTVRGSGGAESAPRFMVGYEWNRVRDNATGAYVVDGGRMRFSLGVRLP